MAFASRAPSRATEATRGLWSAGKSIERGEFAAFAANLDIATEYPGALAIAFVKRVDRGQIDEFLAHTRADDAPQFALQTSGTAPDLMVVEFVYPLAENQAAVGFDIGSEAVRREAAERAMRTGSAALTHSIRPVQSVADEASFLYLVPVWKKDLPTETPDERRAALDGWICMPISAKRMMSDLVAHGSGELSFEVFVQTKPSGYQCVYD